MQLQREQGGQRAQAAASGMLPQADLPQAALQQRPCGLLLHRCSWCGAAPPPPTLLLPRFRRHRQPLELGHNQRSADASSGGCWGHRMPRTLASCKDSRCCPCRTLATWHSIAPFLPWGQKCPVKSGPTKDELRITTPPRTNKDYNIPGTRHLVRYLVPGTG